MDWFIKVGLRSWCMIVVFAHPWSCRVKGYSELCMDKTGEIF